MPMIRAGLACLLVLLAAMPAAAHGSVPIAPEALWRSWSFAPWVVVPLLVGHTLYGRGMVRLLAGARGGQAILWRRAAFFLAGEGALVLALISPLDALSGTLLSAHMVQHALLVAIAPPLLLLGGPGGAILRALPRRWRQGLARSRPLRRALRSLSGLTRPLPAAGLHGVALWAWHAPAAFDAAVTSDVLHTVEHASFFVTGLLFWGSLLSAGRRPSTAGPAVFAALVTFMHGGMLGALLGFAGQPLYASYGGRAALWGMTALEDQQLAGLLMWVPVGPAYLAAGLLLAIRLVAPQGTDHVDIYRRRPT